METAAPTSRRERLRDRARRLRARRPAVDHAVRALDRHSEVLGGQIAAALTYFGFLSFFPLLALAFSAIGFLYPAAQDSVTTAVQGAFPNLVGTGKGQINIDDVVAARTSAGIIGVIGLLYAGLGWVDSLRDGLRRVFGTLDVPLSLVRKKILDLLLLMVLGVSLLASVFVSSLATAATTWLLDKVGLGDSVAAIVTLKILSVLLAVLADTVLFAIVLSRLAGVHLPFERVWTGALLAAVGFEVLKLFGTFLIGHAGGTLYATFGVLVGLLVWINLLSRLLVYAAAWTATQPYSLTPGGIGEPGTGRSTGLAAGTEPVRVVAPPGYDLVPHRVPPARDPRPAWRLAAISAVLGAAVGALVVRVRDRHR
ncbi:MAG: rane protein [Actinomycetota bacterium]|nr:rane protein [Actinomycetota bacterium]